VNYSACHSTVVGGAAADRVWDVVRDFNSYPIWVNGVEESHIEDGQPGTAVGVIRNFRMGTARTRQRLVAHSDVDRFFTYESCEPLLVDDGDVRRTLVRYQGTLRVTPVTDRSGSFVEWSAVFDCSPADADYWCGWWRENPPLWLESLASYLGEARRS